ncbi:hypothetical protein AB0K51_30820 [Kitasatospora sp. NPDC049285]|uniref:hypothetical protein n=1 Tax=Kitasatospora sp. NPDC049285 TaxID=3157096 RepID=UPI003414423B
MSFPKHGAAAPLRGRRRLTVGVPAALIAVGAVIWLAVTLLPGGGAAAGRPVPVALTTTSVGAPSPADTPTAAESPSPPPTSASASAPPSSPAPSASPSRSAAPSASPGGGDRAPAQASLAGRIKPGVSYPGVATAYEAADGNGACLFGPPAAT